MTETPTQVESSPSYVAPDLLSESLAILRIRGQVGSRTDARGKWGLQLPASDSYFHVIERGSCWLHVNGQRDPIRLETGDAIILPHGHAHRLLDAPGRRVISLENALNDQQDGIVRLGDDGPQTGIICGAFRFDSAAGHPLLDALPPTLHVPNQQTGTGEYDNVVQRLLIREIRHPNLGSETVLARLVELLFVQTIRDWIRAQPADATGWLVALRHPILQIVLSRMHKSPAHDWSVEQLAAEASVSRSGLSALFRQLVGISPMAYLARWRLLLAARALRDEGLSVHETAARVGYEAEAAFSRAFKRQFGVAPGIYRTAATAILSTH